MAQNNLKDEIDYILRTIAENENIKSYEVVSELNADTGDGFMGQLYLGTIKNKANGKILNVVIKKAAGVHFSTIAFKNEVEFYSSTFPALDALQKEVGVSEPFDNVSRYFCGSADSDNMYVAMENLKLLNYVMYDKRKYLDEEHLKYIFQLYGRYHVLSFVLKKQKPEDYKALVSKTVKVYEEMAKGLVTGIKNSLDPALAALESEEFKTQYEKCKNLADNLMEHFLKAIRYLGDYSCIIHGDCWSNNFFFKYSDSGKLEGMKLIDFQFSQESTPIHDLSYFFYSGASKQDFDKLDDYLELYHKSFVEYGKEFGIDCHELFPLVDLKEEWKTYSLFGALMGILIWQIKLTDKEQCQEYTEKQGEERDYEQFDSVMRRTHNNPIYRERTKNILIHAVEYGII